MSTLSPYRFLHALQLIEKKVN